ncbi:hypothetical protein [Fulvimarina sp. MAC8]|uniref:hypothetical protein n=1 Tax=Fulvimarina sp. MAC8 TaxID=3162874 RepID=UPI0032EBCD3F
MSEGPGIFGVGLCCSLGQSFETASAAYRAGEREFVKTDKLVGPDGLPLRTAPVFSVHEIHNYEERLKRLFATAFADLGKQVPIGGMPSPLRLLVPGWLTGNPILERFVTWIAETYGSHIASVKLVSSRDAMATVELARSLVELHASQTRAGYFAAIDSFMHAELLDSLALNDRLLTREQPHGVIPSEAAVVFFLASDPSAAGGAAPLGRVVSARPGRETDAIRRPTGLLGRHLAKGVAAALADGAPDRLMIDLNGERWRSEEWAVVFAAAPVLPDHMEADFETPPLTLGYCGAATGAVMAALALTDAPPPRGLDRAATDSPPKVATTLTLISTSQFDGPRAVALIERIRPHAAQGDDAR